MDPLSYHEFPIPGKLEVCPTKNCLTQDDLSLAYTPGVAVPCKEIERDHTLANQYTNKANLVAVITNGTAVLGLGNIGALAGKPVMEGKAVLFKRFADVDVFDIEINTTDPDLLIQTIALLEPTFGGINLEDIKAPECFFVEEELKKRMNIPVFHDDQHGTAIITGAALINALEITRKDPAAIKVVVNGAGAAGIACSDLYLNLGVKKENIILCDTNGVIYQGRGKGMNKYKDKYASSTIARTLEQALEDADIFLGLSVGGALSQSMLKKMGKDPIVFALANPDPEILPTDALMARDDVLIATGRSDFPNQVNNVLGFPFIFRGALDVQASDINMEMKIAAARSLAAIAKLNVSDQINSIYKTKGLKFGKEYLIPKPFDERVFYDVSIAVAEAAVSSGVAKGTYPGREEYMVRLADRYKCRISRFNR